MPSWLLVSTVSFFVILPLLAFAIGYVTSWRLGLLCGFLLLAGSSFAGALMWHGSDANVLGPVQYIAAFIAGGFSLVLLGALGPLLRSPRKTFNSVVAAAILALAVLGCAYAALTPHNYYYQVMVGSSENLEEIELYIPAPAVAGKPYAKLLGYRYYVSSVGLTQDYTGELVDTEYGTMLKFTIRGLQYQRSPDFPYKANIILWQKNTFSWDILRLSPKSDIVPLHVAGPTNTFGPIVTRQSMTIERFNVPIMVRSNGEADVEVTLWSRTDRGSAIGFAFFKSDPYTEFFRYKGQTGNYWISVPAEATTVFNISGAGD
ncbi:MAG: hypothetical protein Q7T05_06130 [Dehalococcoidia bacterium]|nr:hypothetical protein [Dehalococcoidia bacterium]